MTAPDFSHATGSEGRAGEASGALVLASASPRRLDLLRQVGIIPNAVIPAELDETPHRSEPPGPLAERLAQAKALAVAAPGTFTLGGDTVVALGRRILPKTNDETSARACLTLLSGRTHRVHTGVCVIASDGRMASRLVTTKVTFKRLSPLEVDAYIECGEWAGKAGGYAIQGRAAAFVTHLAGSHSGVVGLPLAETSALLTGLGWRPTGR